MHLFNRYGKDSGDCPVEIDFNTMTIYSLVAVIAVILIYMYFRSKKAQFSLEGIDPQKLIERLKQGMTILEQARNQFCWGCREKMTVLNADLFGENVVMLGCGKCGVKMEWRRKKGADWTIKTYPGGKDVLAEIKRIMNDLKTKHPAPSLPGIPE